jgi:hypothetical protein
MMLLTAALGLASLVARADDLQDAVKAAGDSIDTHLSSVQAWNEANTPIHSPEFSRSGIGLGSGTHVGAGAAVDAAAAFSTHIFKEGSEGKPELERNDYPDPNGLREQLLHDADSQIWDIARYDYDASNPNNKRGKLGDGEIEAAISREREELKRKLLAAVDAKLQRYDAAYKTMNEAYEEHAGARPLYLVEGNATYNMIGTSRSGGAYTGVTGALRGGIGFTFKDYGKNGCDIYFLGTANTEGAGYYRLEGASSARIAVGVEQGVLCQIANTVTIMGSPSVQAGAFSHSGAAGQPVADTDWLNYAARVRAIVDGRLYITAESVLHPSMKKADMPGAHWEAAENSLSIDYALPRSTWVAGADLKLISFHDDNAAATGLRDIHDDSLTFRAIRAF